MTKEEILDNVGRYTANELALWIRQGIVTYDELVNDTDGEFDRNKRVEVRRLLNPSEASILENAKPQNTMGNSQQKVEKTAPKTTPVPKPTPEPTSEPATMQASQPSLAKPHFNQHSEKTVAPGRSKKKIQYVILILGLILLGFLLWDKMFSDEPDYVKGYENYDESFNDSGMSSNELRDSRDGKIYKTVKIGNQVWMAENLNYKIHASKCYDNKESNCDKYGRLYTWKDALSVCPNGWHLPSKEEFETLVKNVGGEGNAGKTLKSRYGWKDIVGEDRGNGNDEFGFEALPAGLYEDEYEQFSFKDMYAYFWSSTRIEHNKALNFLLSNSSNSVSMVRDEEDFFYSVRCVKN